MTEPAASKAAAGGVRLADLPMADSRTTAYAILRDAGPVIRSRRGSYMIASSEAAEFALKHPDLFSSKRAFDLAGSPLAMVPIAFDPPEHTRYRRVLQPFFSPRGTASWLPMVRALAGQLIDGLAAGGECDLVADLAVPLPAQVFLTLFGLPLEDRDRLIAWKEALINNFGLPGGEPPSQRAARMGAELYEYLVGHITKRRHRGPARPAARRHRRRAAQRRRAARPVVPVCAGRTGNRDLRAEHRIRRAGNPARAAAADRRGPGRDTGRGRGTAALRRAGGVRAADRHPGRRPGRPDHPGRLVRDDHHRGSEPRPRRAPGSGHHRLRAPGTQPRVRRRPAPLSRLAPGPDGDAGGARGMAPPDPRVRAGAGGNPAGYLAAGVVGIDSLPLVFPPAGGGGQ